MAKYNRPLTDAETRRAKSRARRLGQAAPTDLTRAKARSLRRQLAAKRGDPTTVPVSANGEFDSTGPSAPKGTASRLVDLTLAERNRIQSGAGSQRKGDLYRLKYDPVAERYVHVYGRGKKAKRVYIRGANPFTKQYEDAYRMRDR